MKLIKPVKEAIPINIVVNGSFLDVLKFILSFGKKGKLFRIINSETHRWNTLNDSRVNLRCSRNIRFPFNDLSHKGFDNAEWVSVEHNKPDFWFSVLMYSAKREMISTGYWVDHVSGNEVIRFCDTTAHKETFDREITHWMLLPEPPQNRETKL